MPEAQARYDVARVLEHLNYTDHSRQWATLAVQTELCTPCRT